MSCCCFLTEPMVGFADSGQRRPVDDVLKGAFWSSAPVRDVKITRGGGVP